jgi:hypothetical protein
MLSFREWLGSFSWRIGSKVSHTMPNEDKDKHMMFNKRSLIIAPIDYTATTFGSSREDDDDQVQHSDVGVSTSLMCRFVSGSDGGVSAFGRTGGESETFHTHSFYMSRPIVAPYSCGILCKV